MCPSANKPLKTDNEEVVWELTFDTLETHLSSEERGQPDEDRARGVGSVEGRPGSEHPPPRAAAKVGPAAHPSLSGQV